MITIAEFNPIEDIIMCKNRLNAIHFLLTDIEKSDCFIDSLFEVIDNSIDKLMSHLNDIFGNNEMQLKDRAWLKLIPKINAMVDSETDRLRKEQENDKSC